MTGRRYLFVCGRNRKRSPTAEQIFSATPGIEVASAGTANDADNPLTDELVGWADTIFVMEARQRSQVRSRFAKRLGQTPIVSLDIRDDYEFMDAALVSLLGERMHRHLP